MGSVVDVSEVHASSILKDEMNRVQLHTRDALRSAAPAVPFRVRIKPRFGVEFQLGLMDII